MIALLLALGCSTEIPADPPQGPVTLNAAVENVGIGGGILALQTTYEPACSLSIEEPEVAGLELAPYGEPIPPEPIGDRLATITRYRFEAKKGSYEIAPFVASYTCDESSGTVQTEPLFVDIDVEPPRPAELADIDEPPRVWTNLVPWRLLIALTGTGALLAGGLLMAVRWARRPRFEAIPEEPADALALRLWESVRSDPDLDDYERALRLSRIFREYAEAVLQFPATAWTTTETLQHLRALTQLPEGNVPRAKRLLRATDLVKFAEYDPEGDFFAELDADLRAFVDSTRPRQWQEAS